ncbi:MAG: hypothetical protein AB7I52_17495, partial [Rhizobiaceae bacterium]
MPTQARLRHLPPLRRCGCDGLAARLPPHRAATHRNPMIRLEIISKQNGKQIVFIEASAALQ